ncbi:hypothetical protein WJX72_011069 [[Myrmecia] bisecta]|uniref:Major facilitator superfamily (MFS) profile domain-containing protein n=1 Tax=[Myrmecia] bisecta TaxID=41462 RepID=A0AAW1PUM7_9CHLO
MRTTLLMNAASIVEKADEQVLPAVYYFIGRSLNASPSDLGYLTLCRAMVQALSSPVSGLLGDKYDRTHIVAFGCFLWGIMTSVIGLSTSLRQAMLSCAINGFGLALVIPCVASLIADYHPSESRGRAFGFMNFTSSIGGMLGGFFATNIGATSPAGIDGWRFAFHLMAAVSLVTAVLVLYFAADPRPKATISPLLLGMPARGTAESQERDALLTANKPTPLHSSGSLKALTASSSYKKPNRMVVRAREIWQDVMSVLEIRTFQIIVLQGIVGSIPWTALAFFTVWLQLLGFSNWIASCLVAVFYSGCACGAFGGGSIGDYMEKAQPNRGRILTAQFSALSGIPLTVILLKGLPTSAAAGIDSLAITYGCVLFIMGLLVSWCGANNSAMFAEIVPEQLRSTVYAFDRSFEGAVAACGAPLVGLLAEKVFGFEGSVTQTAEAVAGRDFTNAAALSSSLVCCLTVPWALCLLSYTGLFWVYARDRRIASVKSNKRFSRTVEDGRKP